MTPGKTPVKEADLTKEVRPFYVCVRRKDTKDELENQGEHINHCNAGFVGTGQRGCGRPALGSKMNQPAKMQYAVPQQEPLDPQYWEAAWSRGNKASFLKNTQEISPEAWDNFYDDVSGMYLEMWGRDGELGQRVADHLLSQEIISRGSRVLDIGCGPGTTAIPLAQRGMRVLAVDNSAGMLDALAANAALAGVAGIETVRSDWRDLQPGQGFDLVLAGCFPPALTPEGLRRLERWSAGHCALLLGAGGDGHAFRRELWEEVLEFPYPKGGHHLSCAVNWLLSTHRQPNLRHLQWQELFQVPAQRVARFYRSYFAIFGKKGPENIPANRDDLTAPC